MSWHTDQLKYALGLGGVLSFYGIFSMITLLVPYPSVTTTQRTIIIVAFVLLTLPFVLLVGFVIARRNKKKEQREADAAAAVASSAAESTETDGPAPKLSTPAGNYNDLAASTEEAVQFLKTSNLGSGGRDAVYGLPWFLIAGAPKAGKSSLVMSSNLNFQTLPSQRQSEQKFVRPTPNVDWRVTSEAVFVDTAGRYQTEGVDADEWGGLLETIRKYRSNRPLDGFILAVDAEQILKSDERQIEELAKVLRTRLDEAMQRLKVRFPVYLVFTHADSIEGFRDSFSSSKGEDKTLVWGATIPLEKTENAQSLFDSEYETLHNAVMKRRLIRLSAPFPPVRQLRIFNFPLHFGTGRRKFGAFVNALFRPNPFSESPFLRGFYFTAAPAASPSNGQQTVGASYFTERFFRDVVLRDRDLVKTFIAQRQRAPIFGWTVTLLCAFLVLFLLTMAGVSLATNRGMLAEAEDLGGKLLTISKTDGQKDPLAKKEDEARREIKATNDLRGLLVRLDDYDRNSPPIYMRFGLYSGEQVFKESLLPNYINVVEQRYKKPTVAKLQADLRKFADGPNVANASKPTDQERDNLRKHYDLLKAYLMLTADYRLRAESTHIAAALKDYWVTESKVPEDLKLVAAQQLDFWASQVNRENDYGFSFPRIPIDERLVRDVRVKLKAFPRPYRYYSEHITKVSKTISDSSGKTNIDGLMNRNRADGQYFEGSYEIPGAYTRAGYELMKEAIAKYDPKEDDWVMGDQSENTFADAQDIGLINDTYHRDYADQWRNLVRNTNIKSFKTKEDATNALLAFSQATSPIEIFVLEIARNTKLSAPLDDGSWFEYLKSFIFTPEEKEGDTAPEKEFRAVIDFAGKKGEAETPVAKYRAVFGELYKSFGGMSNEEIKKLGDELGKDEPKDSTKLRTRQIAIDTLLAGFSDTPSAQDTQAFLMEPIGNLRAFLGAGALKQVSDAWAQDILPAATDAAKGYPFDATDAETDLAKLTAFLNPTDGKFSQFYKARLERYFEESGGQLKLKENAGVKFSDEFMTYLNSAIALRKALYGTNATPKFEYEFNLKPSKDGVVEVTIDGQKVTAEGTGSLKGTFPGSGSADTGVNISFLAGGATPSAGSPPPAASNSNTSATPKPSAPSAPGAKNFQGTWGLFKFVDSCSPQKQAGGEYLLTCSVSGKSFTATIKASGGDPFDKNLFKNLKAPQKLLKE